MGAKLKRARSRLALTKDLLSLVDAERRKVTSQAKTLAKWLGETTLERDRMKQKLDRLGGVCEPSPGSDNLVVRLEISRDELRLFKDERAALVNHITENLLKQMEKHVNG